MSELREQQHFADAPVILDGIPSGYPDIDEVETEEWLESFDAVVEASGKARGRFLLLKVLERARQRNIGVPSLTTTDYINTIPSEREPTFPGDEHLERRIRAYIRWNAAVMVHRTNVERGTGGHIGTYASAAALYEVGFNHFFRGKDHPGGGDQVFFQGHASPGIYARAFLEGRMDEGRLDRFRQEVEPGGLASYPHPRLMPDFWEFPTVSMGLGPLNAIYQARFNRYLHNRGIRDTSDQHVWFFGGDGETAEPEALGALSVAAREGLDNLTFVVNCNLQQLDGPVRGNGKIIQELEGVFRGAGWNVIKVVWGREWDELLARDADGLLIARMNEVPDGQFQTYTVKPGAYIRDDFFGTDPRLRKLVEHLSDEDIERLPRGGHDYRKVYAAFKAATEAHGAPTVILAQTVKGWTLGPDFEARNAVHQMKKLSVGRAEDLPGPAVPRRHHRRAARGRPAALHQPGRGLRRARVPDGAAPAAGRGGARPAGAVRDAVAARARRLRRAQAGVGQPGGRHDDGAGAPVQGPHPGEQGLRQAGRADHPRRGPHLRDGLAVPDAEAVRPARADLRAGRPGAAAVLQAGDQRPDPARGHHRGRVDGLVRRRRDVLRHPRRADDPAVRLLLDVRVPADRRLDLVGRRPALARVPHRGDRRRDDAERRGAAAPGPRLDGDGPDQPGDRGLRPLASPTRSRCWSSTGSSGCTPTSTSRAARTSSTTSPSTTSRSSSRRCPTTSPTRTSSAGSTGTARAPGGQHDCHILSSGTIIYEALRAQELLAQDWDVKADVWSTPGWNRLLRDGTECESWNRMHPDADEPRVPADHPGARGHRRARTSPCPTG